MIEQKIPVLLIFGYPLSVRFLGGLVWIKKVAEYLEKSEVFNIKKVSNGRESEGRVFPHILNIRALLEGLFTNPKIAILDTYGEAAIWMWILLRLFRPDTRIVTIFHHYEPFFVGHKQGGALRRKYCSLLDLFTKIMLKNSDSIMTVSSASLCQLHDILKISYTKKIVVVGCSSSDDLSMSSEGKKDLDFLCVGRLEKFYEMEKIWTIIKKKNPTSKLVMIGRASSNDLSRLRDIGIDHMGIVSDENKALLYRRAKVFLFPSIYEGFSIAITEALSARLSIVAWKLPVFEERFQEGSLNNAELVQIGNHELFAQKALVAVRGYDKWLQLAPVNEQKFKLSKTWDDVGNHVVSALKRLS
ncbi:MAG: glycosyltransferase [Thermoproteota archaeon]|nr:glycosyltransferase [Thermoproteota archaeon]